MTSQILVVDDHPINLKLAANVLEAEGYDVVRAEDAEEALKQIARSVPKLILMDVALPGMDGLTLTRMLKADEGTRDVIIVAVTAFAMKGDQEKVMDAGCDAYIAKPIDIGNMVQMVGKLLERKSQSQQ